MSEASAAPDTANSDAAQSSDSKVLAAREASNELVFGIVGHVGSGTSFVANALVQTLQQQTSSGETVTAFVIKARDVISQWAKNEREALPEAESRELSAVERFQDLGDRMRRDTRDYAAVARGAVTQIREIRADEQNETVKPDEPVVPNGKPRAYIIDSIRHPAEVSLLRRIYNEAFVLIGVVCEHDERRVRICTKYSDAGIERAETFMQRDAKASEKHGQRVSDAFHLSDFFVDNTERRFLDQKGTQSNPNWEVNDHLLRLVQVVTHEVVVRPTISETAMHAAAGSAMRSACLSRQVGAALLDKNGSVIATGTNEVPKAGGGVYGETFVDEPNDHRCAFGNKYCSNTREHNSISEEIIDSLFDKSPEVSEREKLLARLRDGRVGDLLEFSRAVHAEMDALLSAGRDGISTVGCRLFVTTFPCHYCARHIVSAGIDEVQFIEPYPKSRALSLHSDSIRFEKGSVEWNAPSNGGNQVLFRPFVGIAPRMYRRAFQKDRELKDRSTGNMNVQEADWGSPYHISRKSYAEFEATLTKDFSE